MNYAELETLGEATVLRQTGVEAFLMDWTWEVESPNFGRGGEEDLRTYPAIFLIPPGAHEGGENNHPKGLSASKKQMTLKFVIFDHENRYEGSDARDRMERLDSLESLLRDFVLEFTSLENPDRGDLALLRGDEQVNVSIGVSQSSACLLSISYSFTVTVGLSCSGDSFN